MFIPEKEHTISISVSEETQIIDGVEISPHAFSQTALKQIIRSQIFAERPKTIIVESRNATSIWASSWLKGLRYNYIGEDRLKKINALAFELKRSDKIFFEEPDIYY